MNMKPAIVLGVAFVVASAVFALAPRFAPPSTPESTELTQVKRELTQVKDELAKLRDSVGSAIAPAGKSTELKWARSIAEDFIRAAKNKDDEKIAHALVSPDYHKWLTEQKSKDINFAFWFPFQRKANDNAVSSRIFDAWSISGEEVAPNGVEAKFTGKLTYKGDDGTDGNYSFRLLITRGKDSELWRVNLFVVANEREK